MYVKACKVMYIICNWAADCSHGQGLGYPETMDQLNAPGYLIVLALALLCSGPVSPCLALLHCVYLSLAWAVSSAHFYRHLPKRI